MSVASLGRKGGPPRMTSSSGDTLMKFLKNVAKFRNNTGQTTSEGGTCDETRAKKGDRFAKGDDYKKGRQFFPRKNRNNTVSCRPG